MGETTPKKEKKVAPKEKIVAKTKAKRKEKDLSKKYTKKIESLLKDISVLPATEREKIKKLLTEALKSLDVKKFKKKKAAFDKKVAKWMRTIEKKREIEARIKKLENSGFDQYIFKRFFPGSIFGYVYQSLSDKGVDITLKQVRILEQYVPKVVKLMGTYQKTRRYFENPDIKILIDKTTSTYVSPEIVQDILLGKNTNTNDLLKTFRGQVKTMQEKKEHCTWIKDSLITDEPHGSLDSLRADSTTHLEMYALLIDRRGLSIDVVMTRLFNIISSQEFKDLGEKGWNSPNELKLFLMSAILTGKKPEGKLDFGEKDLNRIKLELHARKLLMNEQNKENGKIKESLGKVEELKEKIVKFKEQHTAEDGSFYGNLFVGKTKDKYDAGEPLAADYDPEKADEWWSDWQLLQDLGSKSGPPKTSGDFREMVGYENHLAMYETRIAQSKWSKSENNLKFLVALSSASKSEASLDDMKKAISSVFTKSTEKIESMAAASAVASASLSEVERTYALFHIENQNLEEKHEIDTNPEKQKKLLEYRQSLENGKRLDDDVKKNAIEKKQKQLKTYEESQKRVQGQIDKNLPDIENAISKYGSLDLVPANEKSALQEKVKDMMMLVGTSINMLGKIRELDVELKFLSSIISYNADPKVKEKLEKDFKDSKDLFSKLSEFATGKKVDFPPSKVTTPEAKAIIYSELDRAVSPGLESSFVNVHNKAAEAQNFLNFRLDPRTTAAKMITMEWDRLTNGIHKLNASIVAIIGMRVRVIGLMQMLNRMSVADHPLFKYHPELKWERQMAIRKLQINLRNIRDNGLCSKKQEKELKKAREVLQDRKDDKIMDLVKFTATFAFAVGGALLAARAAAAGVSRLVSAFSIGEKAGKVVQFVGGQVAVAAGATVGQRIGGEFSNLLPGTERKVDWSWGSMGKDFATMLAFSVPISGAGALISSRLAINAAIRTGGEFTYVELAEAGVTKLNFVKRLLNPMAYKEGTKGAVREFTSELTEEAMQEALGRIHPALETLAAVATGSKVNLDVKAKSEMDAELRNLGVEFNETRERLEFGTDMDAKTFGLQLVQNLGDKRHEVEMSVNDSGTFSFRVKGSDVAYTIHPVPKLVAVSEVSPRVRIRDRLKAAASAFHEEINSVDAVAYDVGAAAATVLKTSVKATGKAVKAFVGGRKSKGGKESGEPGARVERKQEEEVALREESERQLDGALEDLAKYDAKLAAHLKQAKFNDRTGERLTVESKIEYARVYLALHQNIEEVGKTNPGLAKILKKSEYYRSLDSLESIRSFSEMVKDGGSGLKVIELLAELESLEKLEADRISRNLEIHSLLRNWRANSEELTGIAENLETVIREERAREVAEEQYREADEEFQFQLHERLARVNFDPKEFIDLLKNHPHTSFFKTQFESQAGVGEGYTLEAYTLMVLEQFQKYKLGEQLPEGVDINAFRFILTLHDLGKPRAVEEGDKSLQHEYNQEYLEREMRALGFDEAQIAIGKSLVSNDRLADFVKGDLSYDEAAEYFLYKALSVGMSVKDYLRTAIVYYKSDASSYTRDAGGMESLDALFNFDHESNDLKFNDRLEEAIAHLQQLADQKEMEFKSAQLRWLDESLAGVVGSDIDFSKYEKIASTKQDKLLLQYCLGKISKSELLDSIKSTELSYDNRRNGSMPALGRLNSYVQLELTIKDLERKLEVETDKRMRDAFKRSIDLFKETQLLLKEGDFSSDLHHGSNSLVWEGLRHSNGELLSSAELERRKILNQTGEKDVSGGVAIQDNIYFGKGTDGLGSTYAYAEASYHIEGYRFPLLYSVQELRYKVGIYSKVVSDMEKRELSDIGRTTPGLTKPALTRELNSFEQALRVKESVDVLAESEPYPIIFGLKEKGDENIRHTEREYTGFLSGEVSIDTASLDLRDGVEKIYVPRDKKDDAKKRLVEIFGKKKASEIKIISLEAIQIASQRRFYSDLMPSYETTYKIIESTQRKRSERIHDYYLSLTPR